MQKARDILKTVFGYSDFRLHQADIIKALLNGQDVITLMPTGGGKSLCYQIPALIRDGTGVVISPLIALMQDQVAALKLLGIRAAFLNSTLDRVSVQQTEHALLNNELDLLYIAPERLLSERMLQLLDRSKVALFAIDEAHCVSQWGHDFRKEYQQLSVLHQRFPGTPRIALTATADQRTRGEIIEQLNLQNAALYINSFDRPNIRYTIAEGDNPRNQLWRFIESEHPHDAGIVYCLSRKKVESVAEWLKTKGRNALPYHAGLPDEMRHRHQELFLREEGVIIVATIAFGMGIDKPNVRFVAHLNLPKSIEAYYQETGRAGRDGEPANAWMAFGLQDVITLRQMMQDTDADERFKRVAQHKLEAMLGLTELTGCRRQTLLAYFDEHQDNPCGNCDNCLTPPRTWDGTETAQKALSCVYRTGQRFGVNYIIDVLNGKPDERIVHNRHDQLSTFGIGQDLSVGEWRSVFRQLIAQNFLQADVDGHGALKLTEKCRPLLRGETRIQLRKLQKPEKSKPSAGVKTTDLRPCDQTLYDALRELRRKLADEQGVPAYIIFHDKTLQEMARLRPQKLADLQFVSGVGEQKLKRYGQAFMDAIKASPLPDLLNNRLSDTVNETLYLHTQGKNAESIARKRDISVSTVYGHFAEAVEAGLLDPDDVLTLDDSDYQTIVNTMEMLETLEQRRLKPVFEALDGAYDYGILKCVLAGLIPTV
ncbi:MAG: DNA helicase RecQ [Gammaproteobacteria bacterium]|nr:DNA helicase RecQ [Gammaproteobacteria bacterium]